MTDCNQCGDCCQNIHLNTATLSRINDVLNGVSEEAEVDWVTYTAEFFRDNWKVIGQTPNRNSWIMACDQYDPDAKVCMAQDTKPNICKDYPWYGKNPAVEFIDTVPVFLHKGCSFWQDIEQDRWPEWVDRQAVEVMPGVRSGKN